MPPPNYDTHNNGTPWTMEKAAEKLRVFIRDESAKNHLLLGEEEFSWTELYDALEEAFEDWNATPPLTSISIETLDVRARRLLLRRAAAAALTSASMQQARNEITYNDQGFSVTEHDKAQAYQVIKDRLMQEYEQRKIQMKTAMNMEASWGGLHHETYFDELYRGPAYPGDGEPFADF